MQRIIWLQLVISVRIYNKLKWLQIRIKQTNGKFSERKISIANDSISSKACIVISNILTFWQLGQYVIHPEPLHGT